MVFDGLMLPFGAIADRYGRRRIMLIGLVLLGVSSLATAFVTSAEQLVAVRMAMGVAAAMTTRLSMALSFRLFPLIDLKLVARPLVSSGLAHKAAAGLATAGLGYLVTLQLQLDWRWSPAHAAIGMLPQVVVLLAAGPFVSRYVNLVGLEKAAWSSAAAVVSGLTVYSLFGRLGYGWVAIALVLVAAGMRVNGVVAGTNVLRGLPENRTSIGAALVDTATQLASGVGIAAAGTILAGLFTGRIATSGWSTHHAAEFEQAVMVAGLGLAAAAAVLVGWGFLRSRRAPESDRSQTLSAAARPDLGT